MIPGFPMGSNQMAPYPFYMNPIGFNPGFPSPSHPQIPGQSVGGPQMNLQLPQINPMLMHMPQLQPYGMMLSNSRILYSSFRLPNAKLHDAYTKFKSPVEYTR